METSIKRAARDLVSSRHAVALTGAGISVESGIPPFRGKGGMWEKFDPMECAHIQAFMENPARVWAIFLKEMKTILDQARPNSAHIGLLQMEQLGILKTIITQNIDGLHQMAGNSDVIEFHGNFAWQQCMECGCRIPTSRLILNSLPPRCDCGGILRPECVFFGEMILPDSLERSRRIAARCDLMLVVGTSAVVQPAAFMPVIAKDAGATIIEINPEKTPLTHAVSDYLIQGNAGEIISAIMEQINALSDA
ncbi:MAG: NAD-dependent deacylase [Desulfobacterales bacterium]|nr:NAD-dependent deacylase [Desulfobacterales bacterium]